MLTKIRFFFTDHKKLLEIFNWRKKKKKRLAPLFLFNLMEKIFTSQRSPKGPSGVNQEAILLILPPDELTVNLKHAHMSPLRCL